jgi:hypothetical protein
MALATRPRRFRGLHGMHAERPIARLTFLSQFCFAPRASKRGAFEPRQNPPKATPGLFDSATGAAIAEAGITSRRGGLRQSAKCPKRTLLALQWWAWSRESNTAVMQVSLT